MNQSDAASNSIDLVGPDGKCLVRFAWESDRFAHQVLVDGKVMASSMEGDANSAWPPSPPIQQLSLENIEQQDVILGVGAAGRGHWSICAKFESARQIKFELACRTKDEPEFLGSSYHMAAGVKLITIDEATEVQDCSARVQSLGTPGETYQWSYSMCCE